MASRGEWWRREAAGAAVLLGLAVAGCGLFGRDKARPGPAETPAGAAFTWPADGQVSSTFGRRGSSVHDGIDIAAPEGSPVRAAADGEVLYSGALRGYGKVVIVEHGGGLTTVYAHNRDNLVRPGDRVRRGDVIAAVGRSGKTTGPNLHFEVRRNKRASDPLAFLPAREAPMVAREEPRPWVGAGG